MGFMDIVRGKAIDVLDKVQSSDGAMGLSKTAEQVAEVAKIWSVQELKEMMAGKVMVPYTLLNAQLAEKNIHADIRNIVLSAEDEHRFKLEMDHKKYGKISCIGEILSFVHNAEESSFSFRIVEKKIEDTSFIFKIMVNVGFFVFSKILGDVPTIVEDIDLKLKNDIVTVNFKDFLVNSSWGQKKIFGNAVVDMLQVKTVTAEKDGFCVSTNLQATSAIMKILELYVGGASGGFSSILKSK